MAAQVIIYDLAGRLSVQGADVAARDLSKVHTAVNKVRQGFKDLKQVGSNLAHAATGIAIIGATSAAVLGKMAHSAMEFEQKMAYVGALVGGKHTEAFKEFELAARRAGITTFASSTKAAEAIYEIRKAGFTTKETIDFLNPALALSTLEQIKVEKAAGIAASAVRGMGLEASKAAEVVDAMAFTSKNTAAGIANLGDGMRYTTTTARLLGMNYKDVLIWLGLLNNANMKGSVAGTTLNAMLLRLSGASVRGAKYVKELGINLAYTTGEMKGQTKGAYDLIYEMGKRYEDIKAKKGIIEATKTFMRALGMVGGKAVAASFEATAYPEMMERLKGIYDPRTLRGFAMQLAQRRFESTLGTIELTKNAFASFSIELSKANLFGGFFSEKLHKMLGVMRLLAAATGGYAAAKRGDIMASFGLKEETAKKVEQVVAGVKRGITEAMKFAEKMYNKARGYLGSKVGGGIEGVAATVTKVALALGGLGPVIFAAIPVVWSLSGALGALFHASKMLTGPGGLLAVGAAAGLAMIGAKKGQTFGQDMASGFEKAITSGNSLLKVLGTIVDKLGVLGVVGVVGGVQVGRRLAGGALSHLGSQMPGPAGAVAGALGGVVAGSLPVSVMNWPAGFGAGGLLTGAVPPGAAGAAGPAIATMSVGNMVLGAAAAAVLGAAIGHYMDKKLDISDTLGKTNGPLAQLALIPGALPPPILQALIASGDIHTPDWMLGMHPKSPADQTRGNDVSGRAYIQNRRAEEAARQNREIAEAWKSGQTMYQGEMITYDMVRNRARRALSGSSVADAEGLSKSWASNPEYWGGMPLPRTSQAEAAGKELNQVLREIADLSGQNAKSSLELTPLEAQWRDRELQVLEKQAASLSELLATLNGERKVVVNQPIMLDGKQIGSALTEIDLGRSSRSGARPEAGEGAMATYGPETIVSE